MTASAASALLGWCDKRVAMARAAWRFDAQPSADPEGRANFEFAQAERVVLREERRFIGSLRKPFIQKPEGP